MRTREEMDAAKTPKLEEINEAKAKDKRIKAEVKRLRKLFENLEESKMQLVYACIDDVAFLTVTMQDLRDHINIHGTVTEYQNGANQFGEKQSPQSQLYIQMSQKLNAQMKFLESCQPKTPAQPKEEGDGFDDFVTNRVDI